MNIGIIIKMLHRNNFDLTYIFLYAMMWAHSEVAQSVEQVAVNHWVAGSNPVLGDILI